MPALIALAATLVLRQGKRTRELPLDAFYLAYQKTALEPDEILERIRIPLPSPGTAVRSYKVSKRFDQDISAVCGGYRIDVANSLVQSARIAYGGVAAIPQRAHETE